MLAICPRLLIVLCVVLGIDSIGMGQSPPSRPGLSIEGKVVLANAGRYPAHIRFGTTRKQILSKKATVIRPKRYPVRVEYWNGSRVGQAWEAQVIREAGIYAFRFENGRWTLTRHEPKSPSVTASKPAVTRVVRPQVRTTGSVPRVVRGSGRRYYGGRVPLLGRVAGDVLRLYRFVRNEKDRDILRDIVIGREIDREIERELEDKLDKVAVNLPAHERREFEQSLDDLKNLSEQDLKELDGATDADWDQARDALGDEISDADWDGVTTDFADLDLDDISDQELGDLDDIGIDSLDSDVDLGDLDAADVDLGDLGGTLDNIDLGDLGGGIEDIDLGDLGGFEGGGFEDGGFDGGGFDGGGFDGGYGGDFDYDAGGFDDFGGGFDDFGGGFDDFGGGFDDF